MTDIYAKLEELGIGEKNLESGKVFLPCPDREKREIFASAERFVKGSLESVKGVQCCGLGGCAPVKEPEIAKHMASALAGEKKVYSYCASCSGNLTRGLPIVIGLFLWNKLPDTLATHWGSDGTANGWSSKTFSVFGMPLILTAIHVL